MKFTWGVRDFVATQGVDEQAALQKGMEQKSAEFVQQGRVFTARLSFSLALPEPASLPPGNHRAHTPRHRHR